MKEFVCRFPEEIHEKIRNEAFIRRVSMADLVREALNEYCQKISKNKDYEKLLYLKAADPILQSIWDNNEDEAYNDL